MTAITDDIADERGERPEGRWQIDWTFVACITGAIVAVGAAALAAFADQVNPYLSRTAQLNVGYFAFAYSVIIPVFLSWRHAISDGRLALTSGAEPRYEHVSGWSAILLVAIVALIGWLVWWAAGSDDANRKIHALWGTWVVTGLSVAFVCVAAAPLIPRLIRNFGLERPSTALASFLNKPIDWIGGWLSSVDSLLVFAVATAAGTTRRNTIVRYAILSALVGTCAILGYYWPAPWAFIPISWGFILAFSISRRWAWIEQDRELAMLNPTLSQAHIRVGFAQNLRDEALVSFLSMFLLVPLALRQAQVLAGDSLFTLTQQADIHSLEVWISFYGTELAKAVPFVDWAEVYHVEGDAAVMAQTDLARHVVFATRVLIDLVFLAALLQAISAGSRDAQQRDLFFRKRAIKRLDPFTEPEALRALVRKNAVGEWERNTERFDEFPDYDVNRLVELTSSSDERIRHAADFLRARQGADNDPHYRLSAEAAKRPSDKAAISDLLVEIQQSGSARNLYQLDLARRWLLSQTSAKNLRRDIVTLITQAPNSPERTLALVSVLVGEHREPVYYARMIALEALATVVGSNLRARAAVRQAADHDGAVPLKKRAREILILNPETA